MLHRLRLALNGRIPAPVKQFYLRCREWDANKRALPDFLIIGAQKAGTTSLFNYLCLHPQVIGSVPKELFYFCSHPERGEQWYRRHFPRRKTLLDEQALCGEATPTSLYSGQAAKLAAKIVPAAKIIVLLREPASRAVSHYWHQCRAGVEKRSIEEVFSLENLRRWQRGDNPDLPGRHYFHWSDYASGLRHWLGSFPVEQILVLEAEKMFEDPQIAYDATLSFLGLPLRPLSRPEAFNPGGGHNKQPAFFAALQSAFQHSNKELKELGYPMSWGEGGGRGRRAEG